MTFIPRLPISKVSRFSRKTDGFWREAARKTASNVSAVKLAALFLLVLLSAAGLYAQTETDEDYSAIPFWRQALGGAVTGHPAAQAESVVMTTDGGNLKSYSSQGTPLWSYYARGRLTPFVSRSREGTSYICRTNGLLIAVNRSGRELWQINLRTPIISPVLTGWDGRLFVFTEKKISCMTAAGYTLWTRTLEQKTTLPPIRDAEGGLVLVQEGGEILKFDPFGNAQSYTSKGIPAAAASLEIEGWGHTILLLLEDRRVELFYTSLGYGETLGEKLELPSPPLAAAAAAGRKNEAAVLMKDGRTALLDLNKKQILWTAAGHIRAGELPATRNDVDFFYDERGVYVLTKYGASGFAQDGRRLWLTRLKGAAAIPCFSDDGILFSGGGDWILYAYRLEDRVRAKQRLLYGEAPEGNYGTGNPEPSSWTDYYYRFEEKELETRFDEIRRAIRDGAIEASEKEFAAWLMETAGSFLANPRSGNHPPVHIHHRVEAARLLAFIGSQETIPFLAELFRKDPEVLVKAAAAEAIGKIGVDPEGLALGAFEDAIVPPAPLSDETVLTAIARAAGALSRFSGPPLSAGGIRILTLLSGSDRPPSARSRAQRELTSLKAISN